MKTCQAAIETAILASGGGTHTRPCGKAATSVPMLVLETRDGSSAAFVMACYLCPDHQDDNPESYLQGPEGERAWKRFEELFAGTDSPLVRGKTKVAFLSLTDPRVAMREDMARDAREGMN